MSTSYGVEIHPFTIIKEWVDYDFSNRKYETYFKNIQLGKQKNILYTIWIFDLKTDRKYCGNGIGKTIKDAKKDASKNLLENFDESSSRYKKDDVMKRYQRFGSHSEYHYERKRLEYRRQRFYTPERHSQSFIEGRDIHQVHYHKIKDLNFDTDDWDDDEEYSNEKELWNKKSEEEKIEILNRELEEYFTRVR